MGVKMARIQEIVASFRDQQILVVGDLMLDQYIHGKVDRISPEAPVPVVRVTHEENVPGGASNVAWNIKSLGGTVTVAGILGKDQDAETLKRLLLQEGVSIEPVICDEEMATTVKTRVVAERQQVVRIDRDREGSYYPKDLLQIFCKRLENVAKQATGIIIEDYGKGLVEQDVVDCVLKTAKETDIPVGFDPKDNHALNVSGVTLATPNLHEAFLAAGIREPNSITEDDPSLQIVGKILLKKWKPEHLLMTLGPLGMCLLTQGHKSQHVPTRAREVFDVSGAGDTVMAMCLLALSAGASFYEAAECANAAAGVVVGKLGTATCSKEELLDCFR